MKVEVFEMLKVGNAEAALVEMAKQNNNAKLVLADYRNEKKLFEVGIINKSEFEDYEQSILSRIAHLHTEPDDIVKPDFQEKASVFLSYNHIDSPVAVQISEELKKYGVGVKMDRTNVEAGQPIQEFIYNQTKENKAVLLLLSKNSLKSPWVIYESTVAMFNELLNNKRVIIPIRLDEGYRDDEFSLEIINVFENEILKKRNLAHQHELKGVNPEQIQYDIKRLIDARNQIPKVLLKLREVAVYSVAADDFEQNMRKIADVLLR